MERKMDFIPGHYILDQIDFNQIREAFFDLLQLYEEGKLPPIWRDILSKERISLYMNEVDAINFAKIYALEIKILTRWGDYDFKLKKSDTLPQNEICFI